METGKKVKTKQPHCATMKVWRWKVDTKLADGQPYTMDTKFWYHESADFIKELQQRLGATVTRIPDTQRSVTRRKNGSWRGLKENKA